MTLQDYLTREGLTYTAFAIQIGTKHARTVERYAKGVQIPDRTMMERIHAQTGGEVAPNDFYGLIAHGGFNTFPVGAASPGKTDDFAAPESEAA